MSKKLSIVAIACLWMFNSSGQSFSNGSLNIEAGLNAYTLSLSSEYKEKWLVNAGYQTNEFHFSSPENQVNNEDPFQDRLYGSVLFPLSRKEKIQHHLGIGAAIYGTTNSAGTAAAGISGSLNYKLLYSLTEKLSISGNLYLYNGQSNELSIWLIYKIF